MKSSTRITYVCCVILKSKDNCSTWSDQQQYCISTLQASTRIKT